MPIKTLVGDNVAALFRQAETVIGPDAVVIHVRRVRGVNGLRFEVTVADPASAARGVALPQAAPTAAMELIVPPQPAAGPLVIALVGPTGGGKTTTLAKLATHPRVFGNRKVGLLGLDTYRIGAIEQLRTYAAIARLDCDVAYGVDDLERARKTLSSCDVILVDTPGRSTRQRQDREFTEELLRRLEPAEVHLTVPSGTAAHLARAMIKDLRSPKVTHVLVTKCDEAPDEFGLFEMAVELKLPVRWATDGQEVPFDVRSAADAIDAVRASRADSAGPEALV